MTLERSTRTRLVTFLVLLLVLSAGFVLGVAADRQLLSRGLTTREVERSGGRERTPAQPAGEPRDSVNRRRPLLVEQVGLSEAQKAQVDSIVAFWQREVRTLHREFDEAYNTRYREILEETRTSLRGVLSDEQRTAYDSLLVEYDRRQKERRSRDSIPSGRTPGQRRP